MLYIYSTLYVVKSEMLRAVFCHILKM